MNRRLTQCGAAICVLSMVPGCASVNVGLVTDSMIQSSGYEITIEFASVLNMPDQAKVVLDGTRVGTVRRADIAANRVDVLAQIDRSVSVPANIHAELQQPTVLGDIYVALERDPQSSQDRLPDGGRIPLANTRAPEQLENTLASLSNFVGSGSIQKMQNTIVNINVVTPSGRGEVKNMASTVAKDLSDLSQNIDTVDTWLTGVSRTSDVFNDLAPMFNFWLTDEGISEWDRASSGMTLLAELVPKLGSIFGYGFYLVPLLNSLGNALGAMRQTKWSGEYEIPKWRRWFTDSFLPADKYPAINITSVIGPDGRDVTANTESVLRILGAMP